MTLQQELSYNLDQLERDLRFYQIEKRELYTDRWFLDHDLGVPVNNRPEQLKKDNSAFYRKSKL